MTSGKEIYKTLSTKRWGAIAATVALILILFIVNIMLGAYDLSVIEVLQAIFYPDSVSSIHSSIVWTSRMPVAVTAILAGAMLGIAGAEMQTILDNPLAEPYTLGISSAAAFGAGLALIFGFGISEAGSYMLPINAFAFALLSCAVIYLISKRRSADKTVIILVGVALMFLFQSMVSMLQYMGNSNQAQALMYWTFGSLNRATWENLGIMAIVLALVILLFAKNSWRLTSLKLGDTKAASLGVNVDGLRRKTLLGVSLITAVAVSFTGTIGFVGLVGPHIARMLVGDDQRFFLPMSALMGALLLIGASVACKLLFPGVVFPIGIITSFIGVPFFLYLVLKKKGALF